MTKQTKNLKKEGKKRNKMINQKIKTMMTEVDRHIAKKERLKAMSKIEDIVDEFNKLKTEQTNKAKAEKKI